MLAVLAAIRHMVLMTSATNDNFLHMTLAQQLLAGDWPVRDFYEGGWLLQYVLSAVAQLIAGNRLFAEALIIGIAWACSTYIVFRVVQHVSGSSAAATLAGILLILAAARGYSYPKAIVYAVAAMLWWGYVRHPTTARMAWSGAWAAVAFYWRPDHGVYVALAIVLAAWAAHGFGRKSLTACAVAGGGHACAPRSLPGVRARDRRARDLRADRGGGCTNGTHDTGATCMAGSEIRWKYLHN